MEAVESAEAAAKAARGALEQVLGDDGEIIGIRDW